LLGASTHLKSPSPDEAHPHPTSNGPLLEDLVCFLSTRFGSGTHGISPQADVVAEWMSVYINIGENHVRERANEEQTLDAF